MKEIWKQQLKVVDEQSVVMPVGAKVLHVGLQYEQPTMWFLCDPEAQKQTRTVFVVGTGHPLPDQVTERDHIGTVLMSGGSLVWHYFISPRGDLI